MQFCAVLRYSYPPPPPLHTPLSKGRFLSWFIVESILNIQLYYLTNFDPRLMDPTSPTFSVCVTDSWEVMSYSVLYNGRYEVCATMKAELSESFEVDG